MGKQFFATDRVLHDHRYVQRFGCDGQQIQVILPGIVALDHTRKLLRGAAVDESFGIQGSAAIGATALEPGNIRGQGDVMNTSFFRHAHTLHYSLCLQGSGANASIDIQPRKSDAMSLETILTDITDSVATLTLNRPEAMNALNRQMMLEITRTLADWERNDAVRAIVITGSSKAFAAGADIKEMQSLQYLDCLQQDFLAEWEGVSRCSKPTLAAVAGYALGGGCELAMMCDFILAADNARFGQPEITIGTLPGMGGTQRLTRVVGKSKAMEMCLTGRFMHAEEAERAGLVSRVLPLEDLLTEARQVAARIASFSAPAVRLNRDCIQAAMQTPLEQGIAIERLAFQSLFGTDDQQEGMQAFIDKRKPVFSR